MGSSKPVSGKILRPKGFASLVLARSCFQTPQIVKIHRFVELVNYSAITGLIGTITSIFVSQRG